MGVEIAFYLIPVANHFSPQTEAITRLAAAWLSTGYIAAPGSPSHSRIDYSWTAMHQAAAQTGACSQTHRSEFRPFPVPPSATDVARFSARNFRIVWPIVTSWAGLKYPLTRAPDLPLGNPGPSYSIEVHSSQDYVYLLSENVEPFTNADPQDLSVRCNVCKTDLAFQAAYDDHIFGLLRSRIRHTCPVCSTVFLPQDRVAGIVNGWTGERHAQPGGGTYRFAIVIDCGASGPEEPASVAPEFMTIASRVFEQDFYVVANGY